MQPSESLEKAIKKVAKDLKSGQKEDFTPKKEDNTPLKNDVEVNLNQQTVVIDRIKN